MSDTDWPVPGGHAYIVTSRPGVRGQQIWETTIKTVGKKYVTVTQEHGAARFNLARISREGILPGTGQETWGPSSDLYPPDHPRIAGLLETARAVAVTNRVMNRYSRWERTRGVDEAEALRQAVMEWLELQATLAAPLAP